MSDCATIRDDLKAYVDGELALPRRVVVRVHLARCASCRKELAALVRIADELRARDEGELDAALRYRILAEAVEVTSRQRTPHGVPGTRRMLRLPPWTAAAAAALILVVFFPLVNRSLYRDVTGRLSASSTRDKQAAPQAPVTTPNRGPVSGSALARPRTPDGPDHALELSVGWSAPRVGPRASAPAPGPSVEARATGRPKRTGLAVATDGYLFEAPATGKGYDTRLADKEETLRSSPAPGVSGGDRFRPGASANALSSYSVQPTDRALLAERLRTSSDVVSNSAAGLVSAGTQIVNVTRSVSLELDVDALEAKTAAVATIVRTANGAVDNQLVSNTAGSPQVAVIELRVPAERTDEVLRDFGKLGTVVQSPALLPQIGAAYGGARGGGGQLGYDQNAYGAFGRALAPGPGGQAGQAYGPGGQSGQAPTMSGGLGGGSASAVQQRNEAQNRIDLLKGERLPQLKVQFADQIGKDRSGVPQAAGLGAQKFQLGHQSGEREMLQLQGNARKSAAASEPPRQRPATAGRRSGPGENEDRASKAPGQVDTSAEPRVTRDYKKNTDEGMERLTRAAPAKPTVAKGLHGPQPIAQTAITLRLRLRVPPAAASSAPAPAKK